MPGPHDSVVVVAAAVHDLDGGSAAEADLHGGRVHAGLRTSGGDGPGEKVYVAIALSSLSTTRYIFISN